MYTLDIERVDAWRKRRRVLTPAFSAHKLKLVSTSHHSCAKDGGHIGQSALCTSINMTCVSFTQDYFIDTHAYAWLKRIYLVCSCPQGDERHLP